MIRKLWQDGMLKALTGLLFYLLGCASATAGPWSATLYGGPVTYTIFTQTLDGRARFNSGMLGIALDRRLAYLGWGWNLVGEAQVQQFFACVFLVFFVGFGFFCAFVFGFGFVF